MGDVFLSQDDVAKLEWGSGRKKVAESLVNCPFVSFLDHLVWKKSEGFWRHGSLDHLLKSSFLLSFKDYVRPHLEGKSMSLIDFIDWLGAK